VLVFDFSQNLYTIHAVEGVRVFCVFHPINRDSWVKTFFRDILLIDPRQIPFDPCQKHCQPGTHRSALAAMNPSWYGYCGRASPKGKISTTRLNKEGGRSQAFN
jgi:hypothetical protein